MSKRTASMFLLVTLVCGFPGWVDARPLERSSEAVSEVRGDRGASGGITWVWSALVRLLALDGDRETAVGADSAGPRSLSGAQDSGGHHDPHG